MNSEAFIGRAKQVVLNNLLNPQFGVVALAKELGISRSELYKRIKAAERKSASQFIREIRLEKARELLELNKYSISEIAYMVGFNSPTYFSTSFKDYYGYPPSINGNSSVNVRYTAAPKARKWILPVLITVAALCGLIWAWNGRNDNISAKQNSLAVLPFDYLGADGADSFIAKAIADGITNSLSNLSDVKVIASSATSQLDKNQMVSKISKKLDANYLVDGTVWNDEKQLKVSVQLIDAVKASQVWGKSYEGLVEDLTDIQDEISEEFTNLVKTSLLTGVNPYNPVRGTTSIEAMKLYFKAHKVGEERYEVSVTQAIEWLEQAVALDPNFAEAYAELSFLYGQWHYYGSLDVMQRDKMMSRYIKKALKLNPESPEVIMAKADYDYKNGNIIKDSSEIIAGFRKALKLNPGDHRSSYRLYQVYRSIGKYELAHKYLETALRINPEIPLYANVYARDLFWKREERDKGFQIINNEAQKENPSRGAIHFKASMLADQPDSGYLSAFKVIQKAIKEHPFTYGFMYWGRLYALDMDLVPLAKKYVQLNQVKFPDNPIYTYKPAFQICLIEKRYDDALDLTNIWLRDKGLGSKVGYANLAKVYYLKGDLIKSKALLEDNFSDLFENIENGQLSIDAVELSDIDLIKNYIEVLRKENQHKRAGSIADFLCSYYNKHSQRVVWGNKHYTMDCYYVQNDLDGFLEVLKRDFFEKEHRFILYSQLKSSRYAAFEDKTDYQKMLEKIEKETHQKREEVINYLKDEGVWETHWDMSLQ